VSQFQKSVIFEIGFAVAPEYWQRISFKYQEMLQNLRRLMKLFQNASAF